MSRIPAVSSSSPLKPARVEIYGPGGGLGQVLRAERPADGRGRAIWDGRGGTGRPVASGAYHDRLDGGDHAETRSLRLIR